MLQAIGLSLLVLGMSTTIVGVYGLIRFRDTYSRLHATGLVLAPGAEGILLGLAFFASQEAALKGFAVALFLLVTAPVVTHVLARTAYQAGVSLGPYAMRNDLAADEEAHADSELWENQP